MLLEVFMEEVSVLSAEESKLLQNVKDNGTGVIQNSAQIDLLIQGLVKVGEMTFHAVLDIVKEDVQLCKAIRKRMEETSKEMIASNNELARIEIENCQENSAAIRAFLLSPGKPDEMIEKCFIELRYWDRQIKEAQERRERANETVQKRAKETEDQLITQSNKNKKMIGKAAGWTAAGITGGLLLGVILYFCNSDKRA